MAKPIEFAGFSSIDFEVFLICAMDVFTDIFYFNVAGRFFSSDLVESAKDHSHAQNTHFEQVFTLVWDISFFVKVDNDIKENMEIKLAWNIQIYMYSKDQKKTAHTFEDELQFISENNITAIVNSYWWRWQIVKIIGSS